MGWRAERWRAYYTERRVFRSEETTWQELPATGVLAVFLLNPTGLTRLLGGDWYSRDGDGVFHYVPSRAWGAWEPAPATLCRSCVKQGVGIPDADWRAFLDFLATEPR